MGIDIVHIANGKITEAWEIYDTLGFWQQLGLVQPARIAQAVRWRQPAPGSSGHPSGRVCRQRPTRPGVAVVERMDTACRAAFMGLHYGVALPS